MKIHGKIWLILCFVALTSCGGGGGSGGGDADDSGPTQASVGKKIFFDTNLSSNGNQSCGSCHDPAAGFADPSSTTTDPVSPGSAPNQFGNRNAPTAAYASFIPDFVKVPTTTADGTVSNYQGGQFLDGRAPTLAEQARAPFLNPLEMNNATVAVVVGKVENSSYAEEFKQVFGASIFNDPNQAYDKITEAIAAFESSSEVNPFTSKFDAVMAGNASFTSDELDGFNLFTGTKAKCANCHTVTSPAAGSLFTDFNYFNVGTPANPDNPVYDPAFGNDPGFVDGGLADNVAVPVLEKAAEQGKFRTPTLRNIALTAPYMHNGVYPDLLSVIRHYDNMVAQGFTTPEVNTNIANELDVVMGNGLGLSADEISDLEAFMLTLTDGYF